MRILAEDLVGLAEALQAGALTSTALVERAVRRYAETEPQIHAFAWLTRRALSGWPWLPTSVGVPVSAMAAWVLSYW